MCHITIHISFVPCPRKLQVLRARQIGKRDTCFPARSNKGQVLHPDHPETPSRLKRHLEAHPSEAEPLSDTCTAILGRLHKPDALIPSFSPVGHIALDSVTSTPELQTSLSDGILSLMNFYISTALQNLGLGGVALNYCEK